MSWHLADRSIDHVILERGEVANSWRTERWDSLRLLTPNWQSRLPGYSYQGSEPDDFMSMPEVVDFVSSYAGFISAPVETQTEVIRVRRSGDDEYVVTTTNDEWVCRVVVVASGAYGHPDLPEFSAAIAGEVSTLTSIAYRNPDQLEDGGVLIVGAAATGVQLAQEIQVSGRPVTLAVGGHVRAPRLYRGKDIMWWLDAAGVLDEPYDEVDDIVRARNLSSFQLVGSPSRQTVDLNQLQEIGVRIVGRLAGVTADGVAQFSGSLPNQCALADLKLNRLLDLLDEWAITRGVDGELPPPWRPEPTTLLEAPPPLLLSLRAGRIKTVIWATGLRAVYPWLDVPVLDAKGRVRHDGGVTASPGLYLIGTAFLRRRKSTFIDGVGDDALELSEHIVSYLEQVSSFP
jgi:putative flavoprotein involved in K+ transport